MGKRNLAGIAVELSLMIEVGDDWRAREASLKSLKDDACRNRLGSYILQVWDGVPGRRRWSQSLRSGFQFFSMLAYSCKDQIRAVQRTHWTLSAMPSKWAVPAWEKGTSACRKAHDV